MSSARQGRRVFDQIKQCTAPKGSLLEKHGATMDYHDCFKVQREWNVDIPPPTVRSFANSFFSCNAFYPESWVLWSASKVIEVPPLATGSNSFGSGFFGVLEETDDEIILDSGPTQTWMKVHRSPGSIDYEFGSVVKKAGTVVQMTIPLHNFYAKILLASAVKKSEADNPE